ncbi:MAG TPA: hypothetical protein VGV89_05750 [Thermoplasmata archaeon]|nr:hypothetical protein [Thermoplasmata archaeon]
MPCALLAVASLVFAATAVAAGPIGTPLPGTVVLQNGYSQMGCAKVHTAKKWSFSLKTGVGAFAGSASANTCPGILEALGVDSVGTIDGGVLAVVPIAIGSGNHNVSVGYTAKWAQSASIGSTTCPSRAFHYIDASNGSYDYNGSAGTCVATAQVYLSIYAQVFDVTNRSYFAQSGGRFVLGGYFGAYNFTLLENYTSIDWVCYGPGYIGSPYCVTSNTTYQTPTTSWSNSGTAQDNIWVNSTRFVPAHHYALIFSASASVSVYAEGSPHAFARASLNLGTLGNGLSVSSVTVT